MKKPLLKEGPAARRKKPTDKFTTEVVDKKAMEKCIFVERFEQWGSFWNRFEDPRGWEWVQEDK